MIALIGNLSRDLLPGRPPQVGGGPFHGARALQRLRVPARIVARCAVDDREALLPPLVRLGTPVRYVPGESTATFSFSYDGDRAHDADRGARRHLAPGRPARRCRRARWVHVAPLARGEFPLETLAALARRRRVSFDGQGLVRAPEVGPLRLDDDFDRELLRHIWVLKLAEEEAEVLGDPTALGVREVLVTHGSRGSTVYCGGTTRVRAGARRSTPTRPARATRSRPRTSSRATRASRPSGAARRATAVVASLLAR